MNVSEDNSSLFCDGGTVTALHTGIIFYFLWGVAVLILVLYCCMQKRKRLWLGCTRGYPGLIIPLNLIQSSPFRIVYVLIFGSLTGEILSAILSDESQFAIAGITSGAGTTLTGITIMTLLSILYAPLFASVAAPIPIVGYVIGFFYGGFLLTRDAVTLVQECNSFTQNTVPIEAWLLLGAYIPVVTCKLLVILWFNWRLIYSVVYLIRSKKPLRQELYEQKKSTYHRDRVKWLLSQSKIDAKLSNESEDDMSHDCSKKLVLLVYKWVYRWDSYIQYPLRFLAAVVVMVNSVYLLTLVSAGYLLSTLPGVLSSVASAEDMARELVDFIPNNATLAGLTTNVTNLGLTIIDVVHDSVYALNVVLPAGPLIAFIYCIVLLFHMVTRVHVHLKLQARGNTSFLPEAIPTPTYRLVQSIRYAGFQIACFIWAWVVVVLVVWLAGIAGLVIYEFLRFHRDQTIKFFAALIIPLLYSFGVYYIQLIITKLVFVGDTNNKHTVIDNLRLFHWFSYFLLFQNVVVGITSAFLRIMYSILFGVLLLFRLDRVVLMRGLEKYDKGHKTYIAFLLLEHTLNNSVLNIFVELLTTAVPIGGSDSERSGHGHKSRPLSEVISGLRIDSEGSHYPRVSKRALNRWLVAYTLLRNPSLQKLTATQIKIRKETELEQKRQWKIHHRLNKKKKRKGQSSKDSGDYHDVSRSISPVGDDAELNPESYEMFEATVTTFCKSDVQQEEAELSYQSSLPGETAELEQSSEGVCANEEATANQDAERVTAIAAPDNTEGAIELQPEGVGVTEI